MSNMVNWITRPTPDVEHGELDYETELVVTIGREAHKVSEAHALDYVAGYSVGQDLSERSAQLRPPVPQFSLGKSYPNFSPVGPSSSLSMNLRIPTHCAFPRC